MANSKGRGYVIGGYDQVHVRIPFDLNDKINNIVRDTKRLHGSKIPKENILKEFIDFGINTLDLDWKEIETIEDLRSSLREKIQKGEAK